MHVTGLLRVYSIELRANINHYNYYLWKSKIYLLYLDGNSKTVIFLFLRIINPVQFPLHEPYFDLTPIEITHTKITNRIIYI